MAKGFKMAARALRQLGAELITSDEIALNELIKNAFDANSPRVSIEVNYPFDERKLLNELEEEEEISLDTLKTYFHENVNPEKREVIINNLNASLENKRKKEHVLSELRKLNYIIIRDTGSGMDNEQLENAFLVVGTPSKWILKHNPKNDNNNDNVLLGDKGVGRLSMMRLGRKSQVRSTKNGDNNWYVIDFNWEEFDDPNKMIDDINIDVIVGENKDDISQKGTIIEINELSNIWSKEKIIRFTNQYLRRLQNPFLTLSRYPVTVKFNDEVIKIPSIYEWFKNSANFSAEIEFNPNKDSNHEYILKRTIRWHDKDSDEVRFWTKSEVKKILQCKETDLELVGPFTGNCLWFNRGKLSVRDLDIDKSKFKDELNLWCGGFAIYRDGFRIGMTGSLEDDWMEMDKTALKSSGYTLNRYQTVGAIEISADKNPKLVDAANRERLVSCEAYDIFKNIMMTIISQDIRSHINAVKSVESKISIAEDTTESSLQKSKNDLKRTLENLKKLKQKAPKEIRSEFAPIEDAIKNHFEDVRKLGNAVEEAREKNVELLELAGIGMVVEKVIHELARLTSGAQDYLNKLEKKNIPEDIQKVINILKQQMMATNKRIRTVDILSPSGRNKKGSFNLLGLIESIIESNTSKLERHGVKTLILLDGKITKNKFIVHMVQGLVAQIIENLINNSVYWLSEGLMEGEEIPTITINVDSESYTLSFKDNGPGIEPRYKNEIIKPYFTTRPNGKGLGLYIAQELAEYHKAKFYLDNEPDDIDGRLRSFVLELPREKNEK